MARLRPALGYEEEGAVAALDRLETDRFTLSITVLEKFRSNMLNLEVLMANVFLTRLTHATSVLVALTDATVRLGDLRKSSGEEVLKRKGLENRIRQSMRKRQQALEQGIIYIYPSILSYIYINISS